MQIINNKMARPIAIAVSMLFLGGCAVSLTPLTETENQQRVETDLKTLFVDQEIVSGPIKLEEAVARALSYNLDHRLKLMERAVGLQQLEVSRSDMLPNVAANAGYNSRSNADETLNPDGTTTAIVSDRPITTGDLSISWNVLDFGVGYIRARQQAELALIVEERRRQVVHNIIQDTRAAYWRAVASERALQKLEPLAQRVQTALQQAEDQVQARLNSLEAMVYQRTLLETLRQLGTLRRDMEAARTELAVLMNVHPDSSFTLDAASKAFGQQALDVELSPEKLELAALANRSELRSEAYQLRIYREEARIGLLEMIPGLSFSTGLNFTSDSIKKNSQWFSGGLNLTWNIMNLFRGPEKIALAETEQELSKVRRLALSMAVIAQVNIAQLQLNSAIENFGLASRIANLEGRIQTETAHAFAARSQSSRDVIQADVRAALAELRRDLAYADMQEAFGRLIATTGADPEIAPRAYEGGVLELSQAVAKALSAWEKGELKAPLREAKTDT